MAIQEAKLNLMPNWLPTVLGFVVGCVASYEILVEERFPIILGILLVILSFSFLQKYPFMALMVWLTLASFLMNTPAGSVNRMAFWGIHRALPPFTVGLILLNYYFLQVRKRPLPQIGLAELAMAGYIIISLVSIQLLSDRPKATSYQLYDTVFIPMCLYLLIRLSAPNERDMRYLIPIAFFLCVSQSALGIASWFAPQVLPETFVPTGRLGERGTGSLRLPGVYTAVLIFSGLLVFHAAVNRKHDAIRKLYMGAFALCWFGLFLSFSRASWLSGCIIMAALLCLYTKTLARLIAVGFVVTLLGGGIFSHQIDFATKRLTSSHSRQTVMSRLPVALASLRMFQAKPFFGWGYENHNRYDREFQGSVGNYIPYDDHSSHNVYLTKLAEQGMIGLILFLTPFIWWFAQSIRHVRQMPKNGFWSRKLLIIFWLIILHYIVVTNFANMRSDFGLGLWWVTLGFIANMVSSHQRGMR